MDILLVAANELMAFLTIIIVFPGLLPPKDGAEIIATAAVFFLMSFVWWLFLAVAPIAIGLMFAMGDASLETWRREWPWNIGGRSR